MQVENAPAFDRSEVLAAPADDLSSFLEQDIIGVILQYLNEKGLTDSARTFACFFVFLSLI